jgi:hypothetical protein
MRFDFTTVWGQYYIIPTIKFTYDPTLYGYRNIEIWWLKWGIEIAYGIQE